MKRFVVFTITKDEIEEYPENSKIQIGYRQQFKLKINKGTTLYNVIKNNKSEINLYQVLINGFKKTQFQLKEVVDGYELIVVLPLYVNNINFEKIMIVVDNYNIYPNDEVQRVNKIGELQDISLDFSKKEIKQYLKQTNENNMLIVGS